MSILPEEKEVQINKFDYLRPFLEVIKDKSKSTTLFTTSEELSEMKSHLMKEGVTHLLISETSSSEIKKSIDKSLGAENPLVILIENCPAIVDEELDKYFFNLRFNKNVSFFLSFTDNAISEQIEIEGKTGKKPHKMFSFMGLKIVSKGFENKYLQEAYRYLNSTNTQHKV